MLIGDIRQDRKLANVIAVFKKENSLSYYTVSPYATTSLTT